MHNKIRISFAIAAILLGVGHLAFGVINYKNFSLELLWFLGSGVAMIVTALANLTTGNIWVLRTQNALMLGFVVALITLAPKPQVWVGLVLFSGLFITSWIEPKT